MSVEQREMRRFRRFTRAMLTALVAGAFLIQAIGLGVLVRSQQDSDVRQAALLHALTQASRAVAANSYESRRQVRCSFYLLLRGQRIILIASGVSPAQARRVVPLPNVKGLGCATLLLRPIPDPVTIPAPSVSSSSGSDGPREPVKPTSKGGKPPRPTPCPHGNSCDHSACPKTCDCAKPCHGH